MYCVGESVDQVTTTLNKAPEELWGPLKTALASWAPSINIIIIIIIIIITRPLVQT